MDRVSESPNQFESRIDFSDSQWPIKYLMQYVPSVGSNQIALFESGDLNLFPQKVETEGNVSRKKKLSLAFDYIVLGLEDTVTFSSIEQFLDSNDPVVIQVADETLTKEDFVASLKSYLENIESKLGSAKWKVAKGAVIAMIGDSIAPATPGPIPIVSLSVVFKFQEYQKKKKKVQQMIQTLNTKEIVLQPVSALGSVESSLNQENYQSALETVDDMDGIVGNLGFTEDTLSLAEYIQIQEHYSDHPDSLQKRIKEVFTSTFWKNILIQEQQENVKNAVQMVLASH